MKKIIESNYESTKKRGLINYDTDMVDFINKLDEEVNELKIAVNDGTQKEIKEELYDVILVCLNAAHHHGINIESELKKKIKINYQRDLKF